MASPNQINVNTLFQQTESAASSGKIDPLENLQNDRVYLFSGKSDTTVKPGVMTAAEDYYRKYVNANNIKTEFSTNAEHGFPTVYYGGTCSRQNPQQHYINKCDFDGAYEALNHIHGNLQKPSYPANMEGTLMKFDQKEFFDSSGGFLSSYSGLEDVGYLYVPKSCKDGNKVCKLHLSLHGCKQSAEVANEDYVTQTGYIEVADLNDIIILSPQAKSDMVSNPNGCFDW
ncbi:unnamed protein product [Clavelina lepadiformis]|uniref:Uncharacterized protein n=1 Tax=Clavelina lepadiformis TaxID=159417 RepID=A0ABP0FYZ5_CLALP